VIALAMPLAPTAAHAQGQLGLIMSAAKMTMSDLGGAKIPDARGFYGGFEGSLLAFFLQRSKGIAVSDAAWLMFDVSGANGAFGDMGYQLLVGYNTGALGVYGGARIQKNSANMGGGYQRGSTYPFTAMVRLEGTPLVVSGWGGSWRGGLKSSGARFALPFSRLWSVTGSYERTVGSVDYGSTTVAGKLTLLSLGVRYGT
jgi:hypothetical protein